jgi:hypothetical protein
LATRGARSRRAIQVLNAATARTMRRLLRTVELRGAAEELIEGGSACQGNEHARRLRRVGAETRKCREFPRQTCVTGFVSNALKTAEMLRRRHTLAGRMWRKFNAAKWRRVKRRPAAAKASWRSQRNRGWSGPVLQTDPRTTYTTREHAGRSRVTNGASWCACPRVKVILPSPREIMRRPTAARTAWVDGLAPRHRLP